MRPFENTMDKLLGNHTLFCHRTNRDHLDSHRHKLNHKNNGYTLSDTLGVIYKYFQMTYINRHMLPLDSDFPQLLKLMLSLRLSM